MWATLLLLHPFSLLRATRAAQIFILQINKDGSAEFADGGVANQPVILKGGVGLSCGQVSQGYCQFQSIGLLKLVIDFLMRSCMPSFMRLKKEGGSLTKFWYPRMSVCMRSARRLL